MPTTPFVPLPGRRTRPGPCTCSFVVVAQVPLPPDEALATALQPGEPSVTLVTWRSSGRIASDFLHCRIGVPARFGAPAAITSRQ